jgi:hypothetical protein
VHSACSGRAAGPRCARVRDVRRLASPSPPSPAAVCSTNFRPEPNPAPRTPIRTPIVLPTRERVQQGPDGLVRIALKRAFSDGTIAIDLDPLSLLCRLCASVPAPKLHTLRYAGVLAAHCKWRSLIIPAPPDDAPPEHPNDDTPPPMRGRSVCRPWAELLKRTFDHPIDWMPRAARCRRARLESSRGTRR